MSTTHTAMPPSDDDGILARRITLFAWILAGCWTVLILASWCWNYYSESQVLQKVALAEARAVVERDALYRRWGALHGGVYVPISPNAPANPLLDHIPERDITTPSGKQLTLINPAYMMRLVNEMGQENSVYLGRAHITSLKPLRPENKPDSWEAEALKTLESGVSEVSAITRIGNKPFMRLMKPFITETPCLKCHAQQGYTLGSIRGGISVSIPVQPLLDASHDQLVGSMLFHTVIWMGGLLTTGFGARKLLRSARKQKQIENELHLQTLQLEDEMAERQLTQEALQESESHLRIVADYSSNWEFWRLPDNTFAYMSPSVQALTGYRSTEFENNEQLLLKVIHPDDRLLFADHTHSIDANGHILPIEFRIICKNGETRWISHVCQQVYTPDGLPWGWRASNQDITDRKQMEHELFEQTESLEEEVAEREVAQTKLEELNHSLEERISIAVRDMRGKDQAMIQQGRLAAMGEMINNIAHQWRQPLNNIALIVQNLQLSFEDGSISPDEMKTEIGKTMDIIMHMSRTIDDFRNFFRQDKQKCTFDVSTTVQRSLEFVTSALASKNIQVDFKSQAGVTAVGYQNEYAQVILNILANSREACLERNINVPQVTIEVTQEAGQSVVLISDNCGGIASDIMPRIFDPYFTTRAPDKGTGIGLYMSKVIIEQNMGGTLTAFNNGQGTTLKIVV